MRIHISIARQSLALQGDDGQILATWPVSTAARGAGELGGSYCTPRGKHIIRAKIGANEPLGAVFSARRPTGEIYTPELAAAFPGRDWILTRILWLSGCEPGFNRLGKVDTMRRYIYIHACPDEVPLGIPASQGCIRMHSEALVTLFDQVPVYTPVEILSEENGNF